MKENPKKIYILDVSGFIFRAYYAIPPMMNSKGEPTHALFGFIRSVIKLYKDFAPTHIVAVFDGPDNKKQRSEIYEKYKAHRTKEVHDLPEQIEKAKIFCSLIGIPQAEVPGVEADDTMASIAMRAKSKGWEVYLCTSDKDLCQLVGEGIYALNPWKENLIIDSAKVEELFGVPPNKITDLLALMGDSSDNIPGVKGIGPKTAAPLLKEYGSLENLYEHLDDLSPKKKELFLANKENAFLSKKLATLYTDIPFEIDPNFFEKRHANADELFNFYIGEDFTSLIAEFNLALESKEKSEVKENYHLIDSEEELDALLKKLGKAKKIAFALAVEGERPLQARWVGISFSINEGEAFYVPFNGKLGKKAFLPLKTLLENPQNSFFGHNVKSDLHVLENHGIFISHIDFDTILASYLLNSAARKHSLDHLALTFFGKVKTPLKMIIGSGKKEISLWDAPIERVNALTSESADFIFRLRPIFEASLQKRKLSSLLFDLEMPLMQVLKKMERRGVYIDRKKIEAMKSEVTRELKRLEEKIFEIAGEPFNIASPQQLSRILFEKLLIKPLKRTATGFSTGIEVLEELAKEYLIAKLIIEYRTLDKLRSTYLDVLPNEIHKETGRIHPTFNQSQTATGRLACQDPNLQNIPVRTPQGRRIREAFMPEVNDWVYVAADYSQMELRLLAHLSHDEKLISAFKNGEDIHAFTASLIFNIPLEKVTADQRNQAKAINFGIVYGQQAFGLSQVLGIDIHLAADFIEAYFERYPKVFAFIAETIEAARRSGKTITMIGRERDIPEITSTNGQLRAAAERLAINTPLQGSAADIIKMAMIEIDRRIEQAQMKSFLILQIHDELIFEAPLEEVEALSQIVKECMEGSYKLAVPLEVDVMIGKNWGEC